MECTATPEDPATGRFDEERLQRLNFLLEQTSVFSEFLAQKLRPTPESENKGTKNETKGRGKKRKRTKDREDSTGTEQDPKQFKKTKVQEQEALPQQSVLVTGGKLRDYQLQGVGWLASLYENGLNGILADEMGLGKTIQTLAFLAHLYANGVKGPFLIVGPLSTLANWVRECRQWTPSIPALLYHGTKEERTELRDKEFSKTFATKKGIIITSYEIIMKDRQYLQPRHWKYLVVDEGHRIKNMNCRLIKELKAFDSANRLLLTGTPLQNNLSELWSLLSFLMPQIFDDLESFQRWFDFDRVGTEETNQRILQEEQENQIVTKLHRILQPFLLRRVKADVELNIPPKEERIISTSLTPLQQKYYQAVLDKNLREVINSSSGKLRCQGTGLQNMIMQLRKCCNHPYLFEWPLDDNGQEMIDDNLVKSSGKMIILDRLLSRLLEEGHKVLLFSQMTRMLDIVEDYLIMRTFNYQRIDGSTPQVEREKSIHEFNSITSASCFLLSTRAGGLGINLTTADVVIFIDSDWNPQMDLQAQDRCHRIGQTKAVRIYRLVTHNSIESRILDRARCKKTLGNLVLGYDGKKTLLDLEELSELLNGEKMTDGVGQGGSVSDEELFKWSPGEMSMDTGSEQASESSSSCAQEEEEEL